MSVPTPATTAPVGAAPHPVPARRIGVLLLNLGTPEGTDYWSMRRYLSEFLSDRRVIEVPRAIWLPLLQGVILTTRPSRSGKAYATIWNKERNESPLKTISRAQGEAVAAALAARYGDRLVVDWAMRYGLPATADAIQRLKDAGCDRILLFPLYPQYCAATTATACDEAFRKLMTMRWQPAVRTVPTYHDDPAYIDALARLVERHLSTLDFEPDLLLASFHGLPQSYLEKGDPYHCYCVKTARLLRERLGWPETRLRHTFQSRFGRAEWVKPYTDETVKALPAQGIKKLAVISPGFAADCVETLEEVDGQIRELFLEHGGEKFAYIPCLNADPDHIALLTGIIERELSGWLPPSAAADAAPSPLDATVG
ncbi:ferrochelatase [Azospirillum sp. RWY-5-1]|uniref:Ferrochelatase n=1 Tax=Azospirillum oleiclasticum TaxID=2735135 RepID=A0ABX2T253_9PROT|nr:ferrochelatase [Azospirillum oleiclasticum]NYZ11231.1 ferrochelatase [Azospirillum oleiclasticum]NYZ18392.1 ferrochelatase [Azospirillum oleiclasticum]